MSLLFYATLSNPGQAVRRQGRSGIRGFKPIGLSVARIGQHSDPPQGTPPRERGGFSGTRGGAGHILSVIMFRP
jgi:hypothetical protein